MDVDHNIINKLTGSLHEILQLELNAGNVIVETYEGDWPYQNSVMIFLGKPFLTPIQRELADIIFNDVNDAHYWKAEYVDLRNNMLLCCKFDGPNFESL